MSSGFSVCGSIDKSVRSVSALCPFPIALKPANKDVFLGFIQFVKGVRLSDVNKEEGSILKYLQQRAPSAKDPLGLQPKVLETYIRSCGEY